MVIAASHAPVPDPGNSMTVPVVVRNAGLRSSRIDRTKRPKSGPR